MPPSWWPSRMLGGSITLEVNASPETLWETATDRDSTVQILSNVIEQEIIKESSRESLGVGSIVREVRIVNGKQRHESFKTITAISTTYPYSISANVHLTKSSALSGTKDAVRTGGWTIVKGKNGTSSVFVWTYSQMPEGFWASISSLCCGSCLMKSTKRHFHQDLQDYAAEAEKRQRAKDNNINNNESAAVVEGL